MKSPTLSAIVDLAGKIDAVIKAGKDGITVANAFNHPAVLALRDSLLTLFGAEDSISEMLDAVDALSEDFDRLHALPYSDETLVKMGIIAGAARALSAQAEEEAAEPDQIFKYTLEVTWPYLEGLVKAGILVAQAVA